MTNQFEGRQDWNPEEVQKLKQLVQQGVSTDQIAQQLGKSEDSIRSKATDEGITLMDMKPGQGQSGSQGGSQGGTQGGRGGSSGGSQSGGSQSGGSQGGRGSSGTGPTGGSSKR